MVKSKNAKLDVDIQDEVYLPTPITNKRDLNIFVQENGGVMRPIVSIESFAFPRGKNNTME